MTHRHETYRAASALVKRYAGYRLYNTATLRYTTAEELRAVVGRGQSLIVRDAQTGDDITREILARPH